MAIVAAVIIFLWADLGPSTSPSATQPSGAPTATAPPGMAVAEFCDRHGAMSALTKLPENATSQTWRPWTAS